MRPAPDISQLRARHCELGVVHVTHAALCAAGQVGKVALASSLSFQLQRSDSESECWEHTCASGAARQACPPHDVQNLPLADGVLLDHGFLHQSCPIH